MKSIIKTSKTVEEALKLALDEMNADKDDVTVEVLDEPSKGLFGFIGAKDARVKVTLTNDPVEIADKFLNDVLSKMHIKAENIIKRKSNYLYVNIKGSNSSDMGILIGKRGNTLDSLQFLLNLVVNKGRENHIKVIVDTEDYRRKREETLIRLAEKMAIKVKNQKKAIKLEPMNPYERRIIHSALQESSYVKTYSEGDEPYRRVVIELK